MYYIVLGVSALATALAVFALISAMLGPANKTGVAGYCISVADKQSLCLSMGVLQDLLTICAMSVIILLMLKKRILKA